eukprot:CAMPEP_0113935140 /NCGR_PEP_ID=MMETSP1339-20121228/2358_1 /TAXON_ID=94617 /ORGANISM="Fibrocapsa japonica" /LENGTH=316 /DNA_ID=CAMNT_0000937191 /DNA_START=229 /DNA_END=1179 /DNA_ORIENTATION=- /assembly_acc=CAM_ASM_000762
MGLMSKVKTAVGSFRSKPRSDEELKKGIGQFYDDSSAVWEEIWGEHMHHGYYPDGPRKDHQQAQIDMIEESLKWAGITEVKHALDCGCGIGGSSRHLARKFGCRTTGITLSPKQAVRAQQITAEDPDLGPACKCYFKVADALNQPYPDESFDFIWSMESGEHMPNKEKFVNELARVTTPGGKILIVTWCHRDLEEGETSLTGKEQKLLARINRAYYLPDWCSVADYVTLMKAAGLEDIKRADWTEYIKPFWPAVIRSSLSFRGLRGLWRSGPRTSRGALAMILMIRGYNKGLIKFGLITAAKPASSGGAGQDALKE